MNPETKRDQLYLMLVRDHFGRGHAITQQRLADKFGVKVRTLQKLIYDLVVVDRRLVASASAGNPKGVYVPKNMAEYQAAKSELLARLKEQNKRFRAFCQMKDPESERLEPVFPEIEGSWI